MGGEKERAAKLLDSAYRTTYKEEGNKVLVNHYQDVEPHLEYAKNMRRADAEERGAFGKRGDMHQTMSLPFNIIQQICAEHHLDFYNSEDAKKIVKIAKRDYPWFKTTIDKR